MLLRPHDVRRVPAVNSDLYQSTALFYAGSQSRVRAALVALRSDGYYAGFDLPTWRQFAYMFECNTPQAAFEGADVQTRSANGLIVRIDLTVYNLEYEACRRCRHCYTAFMRHAEGKCIYGPTTFEEYPP